MTLRFWWKDIAGTEKESERAYMCQDYAEPAFITISACER